MLANTSKPAITKRRFFMGTSSFILISVIQADFAPGAPEASRDVLHFRAGELYKAGRKIKLQVQPFQVLTVLLERPGEVVTREEFEKRLWPGDTFVDFEHSLNTAIKKLRQALGDDKKKPRFVETLPKR